MQTMILQPVEDTKLAQLTFPGRDTVRFLPLTLKAGKRYVAWFRAPNEADGPEVGIAELHGNRFVLTGQAPTLDDLDFENWDQPSALIWLSPETRHEMPRPRLRT